MNKYKPAAITAIITALVTLFAPVIFGGGGIIAYYAKMPLANEKKLDTVQTDIQTLKRSVKQSEFNVLQQNSKVLEELAKLQKSLSLYDRQQRDIIWIVAQMKGKFETFNSNIDLNTSKGKDSTQPASVYYVID